MNINNLQKHYEKLRPEERLSAMIAALGRDDMTEYHTLGRTAPKGKIFQVRDSHGLLDAFEWLAMWHVMTQLGDAGYFYFLLSHSEDGIEVEGYNFDEALNLVTQRILEGRNAWREICKEYNLDPTDALKPFPYIEFIEMMELIANAASIERGIEPQDVDVVIESYHHVIELKRKEWE